MYTVKKGWRYYRQQRDVINKTLPAWPGKILLFLASESLVRDIPAGWGRENR
jgi:hypothetical protein